MKKNAKENVKIPVIGNGDIISPYIAQKRIQQTGVDGIMIARGILGAPWIIAQTHNYLEKGTTPISPSVSQIKQTLLQHIQNLIDYYGENMALQISRKYVCWYCKNMREAKRFRETYMHITEYQKAYDVINQYFDSCAANSGE